jgi:hypothetical protein
MDFGHQHGHDLSRKPNQVKLIEFLSFYHQITILQVWAFFLGTRSHKSTICAGIPFCFIVLYCAVLPITTTLRFVEYCTAQQQVLH